MTSFRIRPRFEVHSEKPTVELLGKLKKRIKETPNTLPCDVVLTPGYWIFKIKKEAQHYWSPQLELSLTEEEQGTIIHGLYGPNPHVWTFFTGSYLTLSILALFISIIGFSAKSLGHPALILWVLPGLAVLAFLLYLSSQFGQKIGAEQTFVLHHFLEELLDQTIPIH